MIQNKKHSLWTERYRPLTLDNFIGNEQLKNLLAKSIEQNDIQNYIFFGAPGGGKTTLARILINNMDCESLVINMSDERGIDTVRDKIVGFASTMSFSPLKIIVLEESDSILESAQKALRAVIEEFSLNTRFIFTCNYIERIIEPLQSRCEVVKIVPPSKPAIAGHLANICDEEEIKYEIGDIVKIVQKNYPDIRKMLNSIQSSIVDNNLVLNERIAVSSTYMDEVLVELKKPKPRFLTIRQTIIDSGVNSFEDMFRFLYEKASEYLPGREGMIAVLVNEHAFQAIQAVDKEINASSLIYKIIELK